MDFDCLIKYLINGREIEFSYNNKNYSIANFDNYWYFFSGSENIDYELSQFYDTKTLIKKVSEISIEGVSIKDIINNKKYEDLYVF